jgi:putative pyruvate formate lyase activating enzyme
MMLSLQKRGCHNINLVTPSHVVPQIIAAIAIAADMGLSVPIVYNSSGYDGIEALRLLDGIVDIYMPDLKYFDEKKAAAYSGVQNYVESAKAAIKEMYRQVGNLKLDKEGIAVSGLLIRHLVLPLDVSDTEKVLKFIAEEISKETFVALMSQYFPAHRASQDPILSRRLKKEEFERAIDVFYKVGLKNGWIQDEDIP